MSFAEGGIAYLLGRMQKESLSHAAVPFTARNLCAWVQVDHLLFATDVPDNLLGDHAVYVSVGLRYYPEESSDKYSQVREQCCYISNSLQSTQCAGSESCRYADLSRLPLKTAPNFICSISVTYPRHGGLGVAGLKNL